MARHTRPLTNSEVKAAKANDKPETLYDGEGLELLIKPVVIPNYGAFGTTAPYRRNEQ